MIIYIANYVYLFHIGGNMKFILRTILPICVLTSTLVFNCSCSHARSTEYESLHRFSQILDLVNQYYVKDVGQKDLIEGAIKGMLESLDPHSTYMTAEEFSAMQETTSGEFVGIGAELTLDNGRPMVVAPIEGTPAELCSPMLFCGTQLGCG